MDTQYRFMCNSFSTYQWTELISSEFVREIQEKRHQPKLLLRRWWMTKSLLHNLHSPPTTSSSSSYYELMFSAWQWKREVFSFTMLGESIFTLSRFICPTFRVQSSDSLGKHGNKKATSGWNWVNAVNLNPWNNGLSWGGLLTWDVFEQPLRLKLSCSKTRNKPALGKFS